MIAETLPFVGQLVVIAVLLYAALRVVTTPNLVHTVLWLGVALAVTAVVFVMLRAPFLAAMQLILYTGGALTLMLFGVMMTHRVEGVSVPNEQVGRGRSALLALLLFGVFAGSIWQTQGLPTAASPTVVTTEAIGRSFLTTHLLAFEVLSVLLLAAMVGAIVLARTRDARAEDQSDPYPGVRKTRAATAHAADAGDSGGDA